MVDTFNTRGPGKRISQFTGNTTILTNGLLTFVGQDSVNYKITFSDFLNTIGTTGTLTQDGSVTGTPVLDGVLTDYKIRNLEDGPGISTSVSPENGITIEHNFTVGAAGNPMMLNPTALSPIIPSLIAGTGVNFVAGVDSYTINVTGEEIITDTVIINQESDFPVQDATTITLSEETIYVIASDVVTAKRFIVLNGAVITANNVDGPSLTYTGTGNMFSGVNAAFSVEKITLDCPLGTVFSWPNTAAVSRFNVDTVEVTSCTKIGEFTDTFSLIINNCLFGSALQGFEFFGTANQNWSFSQTIFVGTAPTFIAVNLGSAQSTIFDWEGVLAASVSGAFGISGLSNSGNVPVSRLFRVQNCEFFPPADALQNITPDDIRWFFSLSPPVQSTRPTALLTIRNNVVETVIATDNTPVLLAGTWVVNKVSLFSGTTAGRATYEAATDFSAVIDISAGLISASGGAIDVTIYIAVNGSIIASSGVMVAISGSIAQTVSIPWEEVLEEGDYVELWVENNSGTVNIIAENATIRVI